MPVERPAFSMARIALERHRPAGRLTKALAVVLLIGSGFFVASAVTGCGTSGNGSTRAESLSLTKPTVDQPTTTREAVVTRTETAPGETRTVEQTQTVEQTVQQTVTAPPPTTSAQLTVTTASSSSATPGWVWALVAAGAVGAVVLVVWLVSGGRSHRPSPEERRRTVAATVSSWVAQGWAIENQTENSTVLQRNGQRMVLTFDSDGRMTSSPLGAIDDEGPRSPSA
jgi:hypothetical protein